MTDSIEIKALKNGPYLISGQAEYTDADGNPQKTEGQAVALCRCGHSGNKPFCDGSHKSAGFEADAFTLTLPVVE